MGKKGKRSSRTRLNHFLTQGIANDRLKIQFSEDEEEEIERYFASADNLNSVLCISSWNINASSTHR